MSKVQERGITVFLGERRIASGTLAEAAAAAKSALDQADGPLVAFDDAIGRLVELDVRGSLDDVRTRYAEIEAAHASESGGASSDAPRKGPGRPKLGVVGKEVTLLPRHWAWLAAQRGGASVTLRRLVEEARLSSAGADEARQAQDATYQFMTALLGDHPGFEEAVRALYAGDKARFQAESEAWPRDLRAHARSLAASAFRTTVGEEGGSHDG